jgi:hypothetical protein
VAGGTGAGFTAASHAAWAVIAGCGVAIVLLGFVSTGRWAAGTAERVRLSLVADSSAQEVPSDPAPSTAR